MAADPSCTDLATARCKKVIQCEAFYAATEYGNDLGACTTAIAQACTVGLSRPGTSTTAAWNEACAAAINQVTSCDDYFNGRIAACAPTPGTQADGAACQDDAQCKGGRCSYASATASSCGACAQKPTAPTCVYNDDCPNGQYCNASGACVTPGQVGATCDYSTQLCLYSLYCKVSGPPAADAGPPTGTCAAPVAAGQPCDPSVDLCANGNGCSAQGKCAPIQLAAVGAACDDETLVCNASYCSFTSSTATTGTCVAFIPVGAACSDTSGPPCAGLASCVGGKCAAPSATCP